MKSNFPLLNTGVVYLDSAATTQKPHAVIDAMTTYYTHENANIHRGLYSLSVNATEAYDESRACVAAFLGAAAQSIIFTKGTTEGINLLASTMAPLFGTRKKIVLSVLEHHANLIPWQEFAKRNGCSISFIQITEERELDYEHAEQLIDSDTALVAITHTSNALGTRVDIKKICSLAKRNGALTLIDAAQSIAHEPINVKEIDCDFLVFSGHKLYGPTGIGVLYGKYKLLSKLAPYQFGGDMIKHVEFTTATYADPPARFEAGTPNITGVIGLREAVSFIMSVGWKAIQTHERDTMAYLRKRLTGLDHITIYSAPSSSAIMSFSVEHVHPHDVASILADNNICIRAGHHCAMPLMNLLGVSGLCRTSIAMYTTRKDIDRFIDGIHVVKEIFA